MNKKEKYFQKINEHKEKFRELSSDKIRKRLNMGNLYKEAAIAYRELLEERGESLKNNKRK